MTTYVDPFTGQTVSPSQVSYEAITISTNTTLAWPINGNTGNITANIIDVTATTTGLSLSMPTALQISTGQSLLINNVGSNLFTVTDNAGGTICTIAPGIAEYLYVTTNVTAAGTWNTVQFGAGTSSANAGQLAGYGLLATGLTLNQSYPVVAINSSQTLVPAQRASFLVWNTGVGTLTLPAASTLGNNWFVMIRNGGTGILTISPSGTDTIDSLASLQLQLSNSCVICCNGTTGYSTFGLGQSTQFAYTQLALSVTGGTLTLSSVQAANVIQEYSGVLTSAQTIVLPSTVQTYFISNQTTGSYSVTFQTAAVDGTTFTVPQSNTAILICDGTNVFNASSVAVGSVSAITLNNGSLGAPSLNFSGSTNTGLYSPASGQMAIAANGVQSAVFTSSQVQFPAGIAGGTF